MGSAPFKTYIAGGIVHAEVGFYDTDGLLCGAVTSMAADDNSPMLEWEGLKQIDAQLPEWQREGQTGGDKPRGTLSYAPTDPVTLGIQGGVSNMDTEAALTGVKVYDDGHLEYVPIVPILDALPKHCLLTISQAKKSAYGVVPQAGWELNLFTYGETDFRGPDAINERQNRNYDFSSVFDPIGVTPWGAVLSAANNGTIGAVGIRAATSYYWSMHALRGAATVTNFNLKYLPIGDEFSSMYIKAAAYDIGAGTWAAFSSFTASTSTGQITVTGDQSGKHIVFRYMHNKVLAA